MNNVLGTENPADMGTKGLSGDQIDKFIRMLNMEHRDGRSDLAPDLNKITHEEQCKRYNSCISKTTKRVRISTEQELQSYSFGMLRADRKILGIEDQYDVWCRSDQNAKALRTTTKEGPDWKMVVERITIDSDTGKILDRIKVNHNSRNNENYHRVLKRPVKNMKTIIIYKPQLNN